MFELNAIVPILFSALGVTTLFLTFKMKLERDVKKEKKKFDAYLREEFNASFARKKEIPASLFLKTACETLPVVNDLECKQLHNQVMTCAKLKLANLKNHTNLDLKRTYGMAQFENLIQFERNYLALMDILVKYGSILYEKGFISEAKHVLEEALVYGCDLSKCYILLSDIYLKLGTKTALKDLKSSAEQNMQGSHYLTKILCNIESANQVTS
jgi:tetratricopeptide (TPR) repeat protein